MRRGLTTTPTLDDVRAYFRALGSTATEATPPAQPIVPSPNPNVRPHHMSTNPVEPVADEQPDDALMAFLATKSLRSEARAFAGQGVTTLLLLKSALEHEDIRLAIRNAIKFPIRRDMLDAFTVDDVNQAISATSSRTAVDAAKLQKDAEEKSKTITAAIEKVDKLRQDEDAAAANKASANNKEIETRLQNLRNSLKAQKLQLPPIDVAGSLVAGLAKTKEDLEKAGEAVLKVANLETISASELIRRHRLRYGQLVTAEGVGDSAAGAPLVNLPTKKSSEDLLHSPIRPGFQSGSLTFTSEQVAELNSQSVENLGSSFSTSNKASRAAFMGGGIGAASLAVSYVHGKREETLNADAERNAVAIQIQRKYSHLPMQDVIFDSADLDLSAEAREEVDKLKMAPSALRGQHIRNFLTDCGSHVFARTTFGGYYSYTGEGRSSNKQKRDALEKYVSDRTEWAISGSVSYFGLGGGGQVASGNQSQQSIDTGQRKETSDFASEVTFSVTTACKGGLPGLSQEMWVSSVQPNSQWVAINIGNPKPVWDLITKYGLTEKDPGDYEALAADIEDEWVSLFLKSLPEGFDDVQKRIERKALMAADHLDQAMKGHFADEKARKDALPKTAAEYFAIHPESQGGDCELYLGGHRANKVTLWCVKGSGARRQNNTSRSKEGRTARTTPVTMESQETMNRRCPAQT